MPVEVAFLAGAEADLFAAYLARGLSFGGFVSLKEMGRFLAPGNRHSQIFACCPAALALSRKMIYMDDIYHSGGADDE
jgi:hypothetical protein